MADLIQRKLLKMNKTKPNQKIPATTTLYYTHKMRIQGYYNTLPKILSILQNITQSCREAGKCDPH